MRKAVLGLFSIAALCLMLVPVRAAQTSQNLTVEVTPTSDLCSQPAPAEAVASGYTTQVLCLDMSKGNSSWVSFVNNCSASSFSSPPFIFAGGGSMGSTHGTDAIFFTQDQEQQVLDFHIDSSWLDYSTKTGRSFTPNINFATTCLNNDNVYIPLNAYWEATFRGVSTLPGWPPVSSPGNIDISIFALRNRNDDGNVNFEMDFPEMQSSFGPNCDLGFGSWDLPFVLTFGCISDQLNYHTYGTTITSSISKQEIFGTEYSDHANSISDSQVTDQAYHITQKSLDIFWIDEKCGQIDGNADCMAGFSRPWTADLLLKSVRIFSCSSWATTGCAGP